MISESKLSDALKALHEIILKSRVLAHAQEGENGELFKLMDGVEYLVAVMMEDGDSTEAYCGYLELLLKEYDCPGAVVALRKLEGKG